MFELEEKPKSIASEAYRSIRTNIQYSSLDNEIRSMVVTSTEPGEGKTITVCNLAFAFAQSEKKTIIIDCDLRKSSIHKEFKLSNLIGLSDVLVGNKELDEAVNNYSENLSILTAGKISPNPSEMLDSKAMELLLGITKSKYDVIIIDSPPLQLVTDAQILSTKVDGVILVVKAGSTKRKSLLQAKDLLNKVRGNILGVILNKVENKKDKYYYYYSDDEENKNEAKNNKDQ
ncbi:CpsD/CapB family tyrosine-protein kinase [Clostridium vincentii]|uniref:non-specific protein-tyrosine kinase n=1 Tax=Clostridium vincentii TaxID=52704 RepID=A0A2T0BJR6_9CLOT|nr:CpsD/CapB family tyrosine-protein kinase [Clostridium vincentii]PRR84073.1 Tyrosine-protein kinase YwqD [Clostridium vincentii]